MTVFQNGVTHCPKCNKPLFNGGQFWGWAEFCLRCPWCQATVTVAIHPKITTSIKAKEEEAVADSNGSFHSSKGEYTAKLGQLVKAKNSSPAKKE